MDKDYISVLEAAKIVKMSPSRFANLLREEREQLPVELNYELVNQLGNYHAQRGFSLKINDNWLEKIYDKGFDMVGHFPILMIHRLDWKNFLSNRKKDVMMPLHHKLEEAQARITALETELAACREQLEEARREISGKEEGHETVHGEDFPAEYEGHGIFTMVAKLVDERAPVKDIMRLLANEKDFLSNKEEGYFFHPSPEGKAASTLRNYIKNRLKSV